MAWGSCYTPEFRAASIVGASAGSVNNNDRRLVETVSGTPTWVVDSIDTGRYAIRFSVNANASAISVSLQAATSRYSGAMCRMKVSSALTTDAWILKMPASTANQGFGLRVVHTTGSIEYTVNNGTNWTALTTPTSVTSGQVFRVEAFCDYGVTTNDHAFKVRIDGVEVLNITGKGSVSVTAQDPFFGCSIIASGMTLDYADMVTYNDPAQYATLTNWRVVGLEPTVDGTHSMTANDFQDASSSNLTNSSTGTYAHVDDAPSAAPDTTAFVKQVVLRSTSYMEWVLRAMPTTYSAPVIVQLAAALHPVGASTANTVAFRLNSGGNLSTESAVDTSVATDTLEYRKHNYPTEPSTAATWTAAMVQAPLRARFGYSGDATPPPALDTIMAFVVANVLATGAAALSGTGSMTTAGSRTRLGAAALAGTGSMTTAGSRTRLGASALAGTGALSASGDIPAGTPTPPTFTNKDVGSTDTPGTSFNTNSVAFQNNKLYLFSVAFRGSFGIISSVTGGGITWVKVNSLEDSANAPQMYVFRGMVASGATTGALTCNQTTATSAHWSIEEVGSVDPAGASDNGASCVVQSNAHFQSATATTCTTTLSAFTDAVYNAAFYFVAHNQTELISPEASPWVSLSHNEDVTSPVQSIAVAYRPGEDTSCDMTYATGAPDAGGIALEIKAAPAVGAANVTGAAALSGAGSMTTAGSRTRLGASALAGAGSMTTAGVRTRLGASALAGTGSMTTAGVRTRFGASALAGTGVLSASGRLVWSGAAALAGTGTLSATGSRTRLGASALAGTGTMTIAGVHLGIGASALAGTGTLSATGSRTRFGASALTGTGALSAIGYRGVFYSTDFESGTLASIFNNTVGTTASFDTAHARSGAQALLIHQTGTASPSKRNLNAGLRQIVGRFWVYITANPSGTLTLATIPITGAVTSGAALRVTTSGKLQTGFNGGTFQTSTPSFTLNAWNSIDLLLDVTGATFTLDAKLNGTSNTQATIADTPGDIPSWGFATTGAITVDYWLDLWQIADRPSLYPLHDTVLGAAALSGTGSLSASGRLVWSGASALAGSGVLSASGVHTGIGATAIAGTGTLSATGSRTRLGASALAGTGTLAAYGQNALTATFDGGTAASDISTGDAGARAAWDVVQNGVGQNHIVYDNSGKGVGVNTAKLDSTAATTGLYLAWTTKIGLIPSNVPHYGGLIYNLSATPTQSTRLVTGFDSTTNNWMIRISTAGKLQLVDSAAATALASTTILTPGQAYRITWKITQSATVGRIIVNIYANPWTSTILETLDTGATLNIGSQITAIRFGYSGTLAGVTNALLYLDQITAARLDTYPSPVPQALISGTGTLSATASGVITGAVAISGSGVLSATGRRTRLGASALAGTGALSATGSRTRLGASALAGTGSLSATGTRTRLAATALAGTGTLAASGQRLRTGASAITGSGTLSATGVRTRSGATAIAGSGTLSASGVHTAVGAVTFAGTGSLSASGQRTRLGATSLSGSGSLSVTSSQVTRLGASALSGSGVLSASGELTRLGAVDILCTGVLVADSRQNLDGAVSIHCEGRLRVRGDVQHPVTYLDAGKVIGAGRMRATDTLTRAVIYNDVGRVRGVGRPSSRNIYIRRFEHT